MSSGSNMKESWDGSPHFAGRASPTTTLNKGEFMFDMVANCAHDLKTVSLSFRKMLLLTLILYNIFYLHTASGSDLQQQSTRHQYTQRHPNSFGANLAKLHGDAQ